MNQRNLTLMIALAGVAITGVILLALAGRETPGILADLITWIIVGAFGGGVVVGADTIGKRREEERLKEIRDRWRAP